MYKWEGQLVSRPGMFRLIPANLLQREEAKQRQWNQHFSRQTRVWMIICKPNPNLHTHVTGYCYLQLNSPAWVRQVMRKTTASSVVALTLELTDSRIDNFPQEKEAYLLPLLAWELNHRESIFIPQAGTFPRWEPTIIQKVHQAGV